MGSKRNSLKRRKEKKNANMDSLEMGKLVKDDIMAGDCKEKKKLKKKRNTETENAND